MRTHLSPSCCLFKCFLATIIVYNICMNAYIQNISTYISIIRDKNEQKRHVSIVIIY